MEKLKDKVEGCVGKQDSAEIEKVTGLAVKLAAGAMKKGKMDVSGSYGSDAIKHAPDTFYDYLAAVYRSWLVHGTVSRPLLACAFLPLLKCSQKNPAETKSYRAIAGSAAILLLFERVVLALWGDRLASGSLQMGYKCGSSTAQCSYVASETVAHFLREGSHPIMVALDMTQAFDRCRFDVLFSKAAERLPAAVVRVLIFMYEKQHAWVRWGSARSSTFGLTNGTRQGSVLSPALFVLYVQELLDRLQSLGVGCHIGSTFVGAVARTAMQLMLDTASSFVREVGLGFGTDPNPAKSKCKAIFMVGRHRGLVKPAPLLLSGQPLPWVQHATHLGHEFHEDGTMLMDTRMRRGAFIGRCLEVQEAFAFAAPSEVLGAIKLYAGDLYGGMLARLDSGPALQLTNCWNTAVKDVWGLPRSTHTVHARWLSSGHSSLREDLLCRWPKFLRSLLTGPSAEAAVVARMAAGDARSTTAANNKLIYECTQLSAWSATPGQVRAALRAQEVMTEQQMETAAQLGQELQDRDRLYRAGQDTTEVQRRIEEIC
jgi:hypothetical protein